MGALLYHGTEFNVTIVHPRSVKRASFPARWREKLAQVRMVAKWRNGCGRVGGPDSSYLGRAIDTRALLSAGTHRLGQRGENVVCVTWGCIASTNDSAVDVRNSGREYNKQVHDLWMTWSSRITRICPRREMTEGIPVLISLPS